MSVEEKSARYIAEGRVRVVSVTGSSAIVLVFGSADEPYRVTYHGGAWQCPCPARTWRCAHVVASSLVVHVEDKPATRRLFEPDPDLEV